MDRNDGAGLLMAAAVLLGGPDAGFSVRGDKKRPEKEYLEYRDKDGKVQEILVCLAQGGECRHNSAFYSCGLRDEKSWTTPFVMPSCDNRCPYKSAVYNKDNPNHPEDGVMTYYPHYNKFRGLFESYFRVALKPEILDGLTPERRICDNEPREYVDKMGIVHYKDKTGKLHNSRNNRDYPDYE